MVLAWDKQGSLWTQLHTWCIHSFPSSRVAGPLVGEVLQIIGGVKGQGVTITLVNKLNEYIVKRRHRALLKDQQFYLFFSFLFDFISKLCSLLSYNISFLVESYYMFISYGSQQKVQGREQ